MENISSNDNSKKWYQKPENLTSALILGAIGLFAYNYGAALLSGMLALMGFTILAGVMAVVVAFLLWQRRAIGTFWKVSMYKLTNRIYKIDPISVAWIRLDTLKDKRDLINKAVEKIKGALYGVTKQVNTNNSNIKDGQTKMQALININKDESKNLQIKLLANECTRIETWNEKLLPLQKTMQNMLDGLKKIYEAANYVIEDKEAELTNLEKQYNSVKIGWAAVRQAQSIYGSNSRDRQELEQMIGFADEDMNNKLAEMDRFMELAQPVFTANDIENSINDIKVQEMIQKVTAGKVDDMIKVMTQPTPTAASKKLEQASVSKNTLPKIEQPMPVDVNTTSESNNKSKYNALD